MNTHIAKLEALYRQVETLTSGLVFDKKYPQHLCAISLHATEFLNNKCWPTPEDCGCKLVEECSKPDGLECYKQWKNDKEAVDCFWNPQYDNNYKRRKCYDNLKKSRQK